MFDKGSNEAASSLEGILEGLRRTLLGEETATLIDNREGFYNNLADLQDSDAFNGLIGNVEIITTPSTATQARSDFGVFLSLYHLTPFTLKPLNSTAESALATAQPEIYDEWQSDKNLTTAQIANGQANFSDVFLSDRADMLKWKIKFDGGEKDENDIVANISGGDKSYSDEWDDANVLGNWDYTDYAIKVNSNPLMLAIDGYGLSLYDHQIMFGSQANDQITGSGDSDRLYGMNGNDTLKGDGGDDRLEGMLGDDHLNGEAGADKLYGGLGNDALDGGVGADTMLGGAGDDTCVVDNIGDIVTEFESEGTDLVKANITYTLTANVENLTLTGTSAINGTGNALNNTIIGNSANNRLDGGVGNDKLQGGAGVDTLIGGLGNDMLEGDEGNDRLEGGDGNDILVGATGNDTMIGGNGNDIYAVNSTGDVITEAAGDAAGTKDTIYTTASITMAANVEDLVVDLTATLTVTGNNLNNLMYGNMMNNAIKGGTGNDTIKGFAGNDTLWGDLSTSVTQTSGGGNDVMYGGDGNDNLSGESGNDTLYGDGGADTLDGGYGNDTLHGGESEDTLIGSFGDDLLLGGNGNDTYQFVITPLMLKSLGKDIIQDDDHAGSLIVFTSITEAITTGTVKSGEVNTWVANTGETIKALGDINNGRVDLEITGRKIVPQTGADLFVDALSFTVKDFTNGDFSLNLDGIVNRNIKGTDADDVIAGTDRANTLTGKKGNDTYTVNHTGDKIVERLNEGTDTVNSNIASYELVSNVENLVLLEAAIAGVGNADANEITGNSANNTLTGQAGNDTLRGLEGDDILDGGVGNDKIYGGLGSDTMAGGLGADTFFFDQFATGNQDNDIISDFMVDDKIDLSSIDANTALAGDQAFTFIGNSLFGGGVAGQLNLVGDMLAGDVDGNGIADFHVQLIGVSSLQEASFVL